MAASTGDVFKPGQTVEASGVYTVVHDRNHLQSHDVTCVYGKPFPPCRGCGSSVRFRAKCLAQHIASNDSF